MQTNRIQLDVTFDEQTGDVVAAYFHVREGKSAKTKTLSSGMMLADYDSEGNLLGVEMLGPCEAKVLDKISMEKEVRDHILRTAPRELMTV